MAYRVYLVDDDRFLLDLYAIKFKNAGHEVSVFGSGEELLTALRKTDAKAPDAILLDLIMPGIGGFGALEAIRKENLAQGSKIIILSNQGQGFRYRKGETTRRRRLYHKGIRYSVRSARRDHSHHRIGRLDSTSPARRVRRHRNAPLIL